MFKNVITVRAFQEEKDFAHLWERLEIEGSLEEKFIKHVWSSLIPQRETHEILLQLWRILHVVSLAIITRFSRQALHRAFMLRTRPPEEISNLVVSAKVPSLFNKFETGWALPGLFS